MTPYETNKPNYWKALYSVSFGFIDFVKYYWLEIFIGTIVLASISFLFGLDDGYRKAEAQRQHDTYCINHPIGYSCKFHAYPLNAQQR